MKLLIVLGLFPLFSAQQFGSFPQGYNNNNNPNNWPGFDFSNNNNNYNNNQWAGFDFSDNDNSDLLSLDGLNYRLIQQLRFMTKSLASMMEQVAQDPRANEVFKVMDKICVSNMDETIDILKVGSKAAEKALLKADEVLDDAIDGKLNLNGFSGGSQRSYNRPPY